MIKERKIIIHKPVDVTKISDSISMCTITLRYYDYDSATSALIHAELLGTSTSISTSCHFASENPNIFLKAFTIPSPNPA